MVISIMRQINCCCEKSLTDLEVVAMPDGLQQGPSVSEWAEELKPFSTTIQFKEQRILLAYYGSQTAYSQAAGSPTPVSGAGTEIFVLEIYSMECSVFTRVLAVPMHVGSIAESVNCFP